MSLKYSELGRSIWAADKFMRLYLKNELKKYDLNTADGMTLLVLYGVFINHVSAESILPEHCVSQEFIVNELHFDRGVMTRTMKRLEKQGYVTRHRNVQDARSYLFALTDKAFTFKPHLLGVLRNWTVAALEGIPAEIVEMLENNLEIITYNAKMLYERSKDETL